MAFIPEICAVLALILSIVTLYLFLRSRKEHAEMVADIKANADAAIASQEWAEQSKAKLEELAHQYHQAIARHN